MLRDEVSFNALGMSLFVAIVATGILGAYIYVGLS